MVLSLRANILLRITKEGKREEINGAKETFLLSVDKLVEFVVVMMTPSSLKLLKGSVDVAF